MGGNSDIVGSGFNDSTEELNNIAKFIASVSTEIPWHVTAFHQDYKMTSNNNTTARMLINAVNIGKSAGLYFVYAGNLPGMVENFENTYCHKCGEVLVERKGYRVVTNNLIDGLCAKCRTVVPGVWK